MREDNLHLHATHHAPSAVFPRVDWIKFILKLIWERGERRSTFGLNGHGTEVELRALGSRPRTQKISEAKDSPFEDRPFLGQGHRRKCSPKIMSSKFFFRCSKKKSKNLRKTSFSTKNDLQNFKDSKKCGCSRAEDRAIFEDLKLRGQGLQNVSSRTPPL